MQLAEPVNKNDMPKLLELCPTFSALSRQPSAYECVGRRPCTQARWLILPWYREETGLRIVSFDESEATPVRSKRGSNELKGDSGHVIAQPSSIDGVRRCTGIKHNNKIPISMIMMSLGKTTRS